MNVDKIIIRTIVNTLISVAILFVTMIVALCIVYPSTMMNITYNMGMERASIRHANRAYKRTDVIYYAAFAAEVAFQIEDDEKILKYGKQFIEDDEFAAYYQNKNKNLPEGASGSYEQYVYSQVCIAEYRLGKKADAVNHAFGFIGNTYPINNVAAAMLVTALSAGDGETVAMIKEKMNEIEINALSKNDKSYFDEISALLAEE